MGMGMGIAMSNGMAIARARARLAFVVELPRLPTRGPSAWNAWDSVLYQAPKPSSRCSTAKTLLFTLRGDAVLAAAQDTTETQNPRIHRNHRCHRCYRCYRCYRCHRCHRCHKHGCDRKTTQTVHNCARIACAHPPFYAAVWQSSMPWLRSADRRKEPADSQQERPGPADLARLAGG
jgi:hypothetical protein